jgi:phosphoglycerate dehydrogenase-like enzyme
MSDPRADTLPLVIVTEELDGECLRWLAERCEVVRAASESTEFASLIGRARGLVIRTYTKVDATLLGRAPLLRVVGRAGVGVDNVDLPACGARGVRVVYTPDANTRAVIELVTAFALDALRPRVFLDEALELGAWKKLRTELIAPTQLADLTVGVLGLGRVGSGVARTMGTLARRVIYHDIAEIPEARRSGAAPVSAEELFRTADVLSVHIDGRPGNRAFVNERLLTLCKPGMLFINTSRGFVVDNAALRALLERDGSARAVLDVHEPEPFGAAYPLLGLRNAYLTPHIGAATSTAHRNMSWVVRDVARVLEGQSPEFAAV